MNKEAIEELTNALEYIEWSGDKSCVLSKETIELAISALKGGWIPIEERLPKCCGVYYVTRLFGDGFEEQYITDASFFDGSNKWHDDNRINHDREYLDDVVAWFEVEPYKKGE